jgi:cobalt-zinc-cadmium efflux system outer membrane protein
MSRNFGLAVFFIGWVVLEAGCESQAPAKEVSIPAAARRVSTSDYTVEYEDASSLPKLDDQSTLSDYLTYAALNNPGLEAAFNRWKAALEQIPQAKSLPDPRFNYRYFIQQVETRVGAQKQAFGISQMFPWFGKLQLRGDAAADAARSARQRYEATKLKLFYQVKDSYYEYYYLWRSIAVVQENIELVKNFESVARARYQVSAAKHPDVIRAQVELGKLEDRLKTLKDLQGPIEARLNAALNRPAETPVPWLKHIEDENVPLTDSQILEWMSQSNPELTALEYDIARSKTQIELAKKDYWPDVTVGVDYIDTADAIGRMQPRDSGQDPIIAMFSINLPIWKQRLDAALRQAELDYSAAAHDKTERFNTLSAQLKLALYQFRDAERKIDLYRNTLLPKAVESVKASEASFRSGDNSFLDLIDAERVLLEFELASERALSNKAQRLAELEMLVGRELPRGSLQPSGIVSQSGEN